MDTFAYAKDFVETIEAAVFPQGRCTHSQAHRIEEDQFYCPTCREIVLEHEFDEL